MYRIAALALIATTLTACDTLSQVFTHTTHSGSTPIREVWVELDSGSVQATGGGSGQVKSAAVAQWVGEKPEVEFIEEGGLLRISALCGRADTCEIDLAFEMPPEATLHVNGQSTFVKAASLKGAATIRTETGDIELNECSGLLDVSTADGKITGTRLWSTKALAETVNGAIDLAFAGSVFGVWADTVRGDITLTVPNMPYTVEAKTDDGRLDIRVPQSSTSRRLLHAVAAEKGNIAIKPFEIVYVPN